MVFTGRALVRVQFFRARRSRSAMLIVCTGCSCVSFDIHAAGCFVLRKIDGVRLLL